MATSMFSFSVATPKSKGELSNVPEIMMTVTKDKIRLNGALTRKLGLQHGDRLMFITNRDAVLNAVAEGTIDESQVEENVVYAIAKSVPQIDANGKVKTAARRLSKEEAAAFEAGKLDCEVDVEGKPIETAFHGFKLASTTGSAGYGQILEGSDATQWPLLGGNEETHKVYVLGESFAHEVSGQEVTAHILVFDREEAKAERAPKGEGKVSEKIAKKFDSEEYE